MPKEVEHDDVPIYYKGWFISLATIFVVMLLVVGSVFVWPQKTLGTAVRMVTNGPAPNANEIISGDLPGTSVIRDKDGNIITFFYDQRRQIVRSEDINPIVKKALVAIEDKRFYEHEGVDWYGVMRAAVTNATSDDTQGASTLTQQYVKNYTWLISSKTDEEREQAIAQTKTRKLTEITTAEDVNQALSKDEILTRYLNLVSYGRGSFGIEDAARTYFNVSAKDLTLTQAALLVGMVQSPSFLDPYSNPQGAKERRDTVIDVMVQQGIIDDVKGQAAKLEPLGVLDVPHVLPNGCSSLVVDGFFCEKVVQDLDRQGISIDKLKTENYDITTSLDRTIQDSVRNALVSNVNPKQEGVAETMALIEPGKNSRFIRAVSSSRDFGYNDAEKQTSLPLTSSLVGNGAGSVFKVFTASLAVSKGMGINAPVNVPATYQASGLGFGGNSGCPADKYCVSNVGTYPSKMTFTDILAQSPNTPFISLAEQVGNPEIVDLAVKMGLRSYADGDPGNTIVDQMKGSGSFTLGPTPVNTIEMSNVAATLSSEGVWCEPTTLAKVTHNGKPVSLSTPPCEQVLNDRDARLMTHALSKDSVSGTAHIAAVNAGWGNRPLSAKTGTTDAHQSASFFGYTPGLAGFVYAFNDNNNSPLCTAPLRQCGEGNIYGGNEPAMTWMQAVLPIVDRYGGTELPRLSADDAKTINSSLDDIKSLVYGKSQSDAEAMLKAKGYDVKITNGDNKDVSAGQAYDVILDEARVKGGRVTLLISNTGRESQRPETTARNTPPPKTTTKAPPVRNTQPPVTKQRNS